MGYQIVVMKGLQEMLARNNRFALAGKKRRRKVDVERM
jgi:hypothetical protein